MDNTKKQTEELNGKGLALNMEELVNERDRLEKQEEHLKFIGSRFMLARLVSFVLSAAGWIFGIFGPYKSILLVAAALTVLFGFLLVAHAKHIKQEEQNRAKIRVCRRDLARSGDGWKVFEETGYAYRKEDAYVASDLDLLGRNSLYQFICRAHTEMGKDALAKAISDAAAGHADFGQKRAGAVSELASHRGFLREFEAYGMVYENRRKRSKESERPQYEVKTACFLWIWSLCILLGLAGLLVLAAFVKQLFYLPAMWIIVAMGVSAWVSGRYHDLLVEVAEQDLGSRGLLDMIQVFADEPVTDAYLTDLQKTIREKYMLEGFRKLDPILSLCRLRFNPILRWLCNGLFGYDCFMVAILSVWYEQHSALFADSKALIGELEVLVSLTAMAQARNCVQPILRKDAEPYIHLKEAYHPLLDPIKAVANSVDLQAETIVVTGSNMSGKTTFLRTVGINLVLAYMGAPVCAKGMEASVLKLFTSMRVTDDITGGISTFYAEIRRIQAMAEYRKTGKTYLCLIDEIFKGTNSADRILGATKAVSKLSSSHGVVMVSTHDFELCKLGKNYHFEEYYEGDAIRFDYQLKTGACTTTNAMYLLRLAGLADE